MTTKLLTEATYVLSIVADSGYESTTEGRCNVQQYSAAVRALHDAAWAHEITQARADLEAENKRLREAIQKQLDPSWECNSNHPALYAVLKDTK